MLPWWGWVLLWLVLLLGSAAFLGLAGAAGVGEHQGARPRGAAGRASWWPSWRRRADELRDVEPDPDRGHPATSQDAGAVSGATGHGEGRPATPAVPTGCRRGRAYTDARPRTTRHRRHTTSQEMDPMGRIGPTEIIIVAVLIIVIFGWKKLP